MAKNDLQKAVEEVDAEGLKSSETVTSLGNSETDINQIPQKKAIPVPQNHEWKTRYAENGPLEIFAFVKNGLNSLLKLFKEAGFTPHSEKVMGETEISLRGHEAMAALRQGIFPTHKAKDYKAVNPEKTPPEDPDILHDKSWKCAYTGNGELVADFRISPWDSPKEIRNHLEELGFNPEIYTDSNGDKFVRLRRYNAQAFIKAHVPQYEGKNFVPVLSDERLAEKKTGIRTEFKQKTFINDKGFIRSYIDVSDTNDRDMSRITKALDKRGISYEEKRDTKIFPGPMLELSGQQGLTKAFNEQVLKGGIQPRPANAGLDVYYEYEENGAPIAHIDVSEISNEDHLSMEAELLKNHINYEYTGTSRHANSALILRGDSIQKAFDAKLLKGKMPKPPAKSVTRPPLQEIDFDPDGVMTTQIDLTHVSLEDEETLKSDLAERGIQYKQKDQSKILTLKGANAVNAFKSNLTKTNLQKPSGGEAYYDGLGDIKTLPWQGHILKDGQLMAYADIKDIAPKELAKLKKQYGSVLEEKTDTNGKPFISITGKHARTLYNAGILLNSTRSEAAKNAIEQRVANRLNHKQRIVAEHGLWEKTQKRLEKTFGPELDR